MLWHWNKFSIFTISLLILITSSVFSPAYGELIHTFDDPTPTGSDFFGASVSIDGNNVLVGAQGDNTNGEAVGQAHLFDATTGLLLQTFDDPTVTVADSFGSSVSIDGNNVLVGAFFDSSGVGQAHLFDATTGALLQTFDDPEPTTFDFFGRSVSISGNNVLVGAPSHTISFFAVGQAHLFDATTGLLLQTFNDPTPTSDDNFGSSVSIDGNNVLVGAPFDSTNGQDVGQAYLFDATTGLLLQTFDDPTVTVADSFGSSVSIDGNNVLVGAPGDSTNGNFVGQAHLFDATTGNLLQTFDDPTVTTFDAFGRSVSISGNNVLVGAGGDDTNGGNVGQAHLFDATTGALLQTFDDPTVTTFDLFGNSVSIDGNNVLVGAPNDDTNGIDVGQAHLFDISTVPPSLPTVSINDVSLAEGDAGLTAFTFTVTRSDNTDAISVDFATADGTATIADNDYQAAGGTLTFNAGGLLSKTITVQVNGDLTAEPNETFFVNLSTCVGCGFTDNQGLGTILNDDAAPPGPVGGTMIPIDTTALLLAGAQMNAAWLIPVIVVAIGFAIVIARKL